MGQWLPQGERSGMEGIPPNPKLKLLDQVREVMRLKHYSIRTERCYVTGFGATSASISVAAGGHGGRRCEDRAVLSDLAVNGHVAASTQNPQNQTFNAPLFVYREVLHQELQNIQAVRADRPVKVPVGADARRSQSRRLAS